MPPILNSYDEFVDIVNAKVHVERKPYLLDICVAIRQEYALYESLTHNLSAIPPRRYNDYSKECLNDCYTGSTKALRDLKSKLELHHKNTMTVETRQQCQYCGIGKPLTIDHYLPQEAFPEYAVYTKNLIPCCSECNGKKGTKFTDENSENRLILNLYYDQLSHERYLDVDFEYSANSLIPRFKFKDNPYIDPELFRIIKSHYKELELFDRFEKSSHKAISELRLSIQKFACSSDLSLIKSRLLSQSQGLVDLYSNNYWQAVLHEGLSNEDPFIRSCCVS